MNILAIETSCDETSVAIVADGRTILANVVASSMEMHRKYGGIVPEVAARKQLEFMVPVLEEAVNQFKEQLSISNYQLAIQDIDAIAVTIGPGLIGSLLVGVETAKTLAYAWNKPIIPVNHVLAHPYAVFLSEKKSEQRTMNNKYKYNISPQSSVQSSKLAFPAIVLIVSGGHTELYLMKNVKSMKWIGGTLDDAAGECFDKCARLFGLHYPGGPEIAAEAEKFTVHSSQFTVSLPRPMIHDDSLNFSFSGLKTAVLREWRKLNNDNCHSGKLAETNSECIQNQEIKRPLIKDYGRVSSVDSEFTCQNDVISALAYEIQESITDVLVKKTLKAQEKYSAKSIIVSGGVAANQRLKQKFNSELLILNSKLSLFFPPPALCTDTASYIAAYAYYHNQPADWRHLEPQPDMDVEINS